MASRIHILRKLNALSNASVFSKDGARRISNGTWPPPLTAILSEIDDTVIKRNLVFSNSSGCMSLVVANRRLVTCLEATGDFNIDNDIVGQSLSITETSLVGAVAELLVEFAQQEGNLTVHSGTNLIAENPSGAGVPVPVLADVMGLDLEEETEGPLQHFIQSAEERFRSAVFYQDDTETGETGDDAEIDAIRLFLNDDWGDIRNALAFRKPDAHTPFLIILAEAIGPDVSLFLAQEEGALLAFSALEEDAPDIQEYWNNFFVI